jgi:hypothetical protein
MFQPLVRRWNAFGHGWNTLGTFLLNNFFPNLPSCSFSKLTKQAHSMLINKLVIRSLERIHFKFLLIFDELFSIIYYRFCILFFVEL